MATQRNGGTRAYVNGQLRSLETATVTVVDAGFLLGMGVFETLKVEDGIPLFWEDHLRRLLRGLRKLGIPNPPWDVSAAIRQVIQRNRLVTAAIRVRPYMA